MGHDNEIAREHYLTVPAQHIARAIAGECTPANREKPRAKPRSLCTQNLAERRETKDGRIREPHLRRAVRDLRLRARTRSRTLYPQGESNPCLQDENLIS